MDILCFTLFMNLLLISIDVCTSNTIIECEPSSIHLINKSDVMKVDKRKNSTVLLLKSHYVIAGMISDWSNVRSRNVTVDIYHLTNEEEEVYSVPIQSNTLTFLNESIVSKKVLITVPILNTTLPVKFFGCIFEIKTTGVIWAPITTSDVWIPNTTDKSLITTTTTNTMISGSCYTTDLASSSDSILSGSGVIYIVIIPVVVMCIANVTALAVLMIFIRKGRKKSRRRSRTIREIPNESLYALSSIEEKKIADVQHPQHVVEDIYTPVLDSPRVLGVDEGVWPQGDGGPPSQQEASPPLPDSRPTPEPTDTPCPYSVPVSTLPRPKMTLNKFDDRQYCEVTPLSHVNTWPRLTVNNERN